ncbi:AraC-like DNA-binding protein [Pedobacter cryoconitis]|uniref:AraC-like DNA-binding protein n=1 Tax=Pedobacter cryoconitis TaxID=188932 RepID=A0A327SRC3_9SPHI|nr:AraC-like DNA-binding protein [Pedobacter cryoconitis]
MSVKQNLYYPFEILYKEINECSNSGYSQNFFELVYIVEGTGIQHINKNTFNYAAGHLLLITPEDLNAFEILTTTKVLFICFNDIYLKSGPVGVNDKERIQWVKRLKFILHHATHLPGCILKDEIDKVLVRSLAASIVEEQRCSNLYSKELIQQLMNSLIILVARSIADSLPTDLSPVTDQKLLGVFQYIQDNIYFPDRLKVTVICSHFNISPNYFGKFFKKHAGETLQDYILKYKIKIIETRLLSSDMRINEIVSELKFSDESHLNRIFKKYKGVSPSVFRKNELVL